MIATVLDSDDRGEEVREALETTENALIRLDADLASQGIVPSLTGRRVPRLGRGGAALRRTSSRRSASCARS